MMFEIQFQNSCVLCVFVLVILVLVVGDVVWVEGLVIVLVVGGLLVFEVMLCIFVVLDVICEMFKVEGGYVGVGMVFSFDDVCCVKDVGVSFVVVFGVIECLVCVCQEIGLLLLFGVVIVFEVMWVMEFGYFMLKFFFVEVVGGVKFLKFLVGLLLQVSFCLIGGVILMNVFEYLVLFNVICVGGSWVVFDIDVLLGNWDQIEVCVCEVVFLKYG